MSMVSCSLHCTHVYISATTLIGCKKKHFDEGRGLHLSIVIKRNIESAISNYCDLHIVAINCSRVHDPLVTGKIRKHKSCVKMVI